MTTDTIFLKAIKDKYIEIQKGLTQTIKYEKSDDFIKNKKSNDKEEFISDKEIFIYKLEEIQKLISKCNANNFNHIGVILDDFNNQLYGKMIQIQSGTAKEDEKYYYQILMHKRKVIKQILNEAEEIFEIQKNNANDTQ
jgi:hypothetical protein